MKRWRFLPNSRAPIHAKFLRLTFNESMRASSSQKSSEGRNPDSQCSGCLV
jgi:hypothetical protein